MRFEDQRSEQLASSCCVVEVLQSLFRPPFVGGIQVCSFTALEYGGRTRGNHRNVGLNRFVNPRVEDDVGLEFLLSVLVIQTRVLSRRHSEQPSEAHKATLQHVVPCEFLRAVDGVFDSEWGSARTAASLWHVWERLSGRVRHREAHLLVGESKLLCQGVRLPEQSGALVRSAFHAGNRFLGDEVLLDVLATPGSEMSNCKFSERLRLPTSL